MALVMGRSPQLLFSSGIGERCGDSQRGLWRKSGKLRYAQKSLRSVTTSSMKSLDGVKTFRHEKLSEEEELYMFTTGRHVQWYPGHIAKAEKDLRLQLAMVDVVIEIRDARIPLSTRHPQLDEWVKKKKKVLVMNRVDMISPADQDAWANYFSRINEPVVFVNGQLGKGINKLTRQACSVAEKINLKRKQKGLLNRSVRAAVVGFPNVGKSSIINRLVKRRVCEAAKRAGVTRALRWSRIHEELDLLDSPGILPMRLDDQVAAAKLAICNDIGQESYDHAGVAAVLIERLRLLPGAGDEALTARYRFDTAEESAESFLKVLAHKVFGGDVNQAAERVLNDYRNGKFGWFALERPPRVSRK